MQKTVFTRIIWHWSFHQPAFINDKIWATDWLRLHLFHHHNVQDLVIMIIKWPIEEVIIPSKPPATTCNQVKRKASILFWNPDFSSLVDGIKELQMNIPQCLIRSLKPPQPKKKQKSAKKLLSIREASYSKGNPQCLYHLRFSIMPKMIVKRQWLAKQQSFNICLIIIPGLSSFTNL